MAIETIGDVVGWARGYHDRVAAQELFDELIALEEHDAIQVTRGANPLHDY